MEKRPQQDPRFYKNGSYPVIRNWFRSKSFINDPPRIDLPRREMDWSSSHKGQMLSVWLITIVFSVLIIGAVIAKNIPT